MNRTAGDDPATGVAEYGGVRFVKKPGEAFVIAGWVSLWVPIERLGFDGWLLKDQLRLSKRLAAMQVEVVPAG